MVTNSKTYLYTGLLAALTANLSAAPKLSLLQTAPPVITVAAGSNSSLSIDAKNVGDGTLNLKASANAAWLVPTVGAAHACSDGSGASCFPINIALQTASLAAGNYTAFVTAVDPNAVDSPQSVSVSIQIGAGVPAKLDFTLPPGGSASTLFSTTPSAAVSATSGTTGLVSVMQNGGSPFSPTIPYQVTASATAASLTPGDYTGTVTVAGSTNAADNKAIPVTVHVVASTLTGPIANLGGLLNNTTYAPGEPLAQGDIVALFGSNFISGMPVGASALPLSTTLGGVQVLLNGQPVPMYYVSAAQINFQIPFDAQIGAATVQVVSNGTNGNIISATIAKAVPRILRLNGTFGDYGIVTNADNSLVLPTSFGIGHPTQTGQTIVIYAIGFGPTSPAVASGAGSPSSAPLALLTDHPMVCFIAPTPFNPNGLCATPSFAGLAPGFVGLYQINVVVPAGTPTGDLTPLFIQTDDGVSNTVLISVSQ